MNFKVIIAGLIAASAALAGTPAYAAQADIGDWVKAVNKKLDRTMVFPSNGRHGTAWATFQRTNKGRAVLVSVRSNDRAVERAARQTVARLRNLPPLPAGFSDTVKMQMLIGDPNHAPDFYKQRATMLAAAAGSNERLAARVAGMQLAMSEVR